MKDFLRPGKFRQDWRGAPLNRGLSTSLRNHPAPGHPAQDDRKPTRSLTKLSERFYFEVEVGI